MNHTNGRQLLNILLIEDESDDEELVRIELHRAKYKPNLLRVETESALLVALASRDKWDLVLCDYILPFLKAEKALELVRDYLGDVPFIMLSGYEDETTALDMLKLGANDFIYKSQLRRLPVAIKREIRGRGERTSSRLAVEKAYASLIEGFGVAMERRDIYTNDHTIRVTDLALRLARELGVSSDQFQNIRYGALLHDIGKIGLPDAVLIKRDTLDLPEMAIMKMHPIIAEEMLSSIEGLEGAKIIPYCHHEKFDGSGYPRGLAGEEIPFEARLFSVCDVYDALTNERPYRKPWKKEAAIEHLISEKGKSFDPEIVDKFIEMIK